MERVELNNSTTTEKNYKIIQTPQCFESTTILEAFKQDYKVEFTDDATVIESNGSSVFLTHGNVENIKINGFDYYKK